MSLLTYASTAINRLITLRLPIKCRNYGLDVYNLKRVTYCTIPTKTIHNVNTNVLKDVILFKYENPKFYKYMNIFGIVQYSFWTYLGLFSFTTLKDVPVDKSKIDESTPFYEKINLGENKYKNSLAAFAIIIGVGTLSSVWMYTLRSVRYLILNKGGKNITIVTYTPFGKNRMMTVPLQYVCCKDSRNMSRVQLPLKVKNKWLHYMLDMRGEFKNPLLFDSTAGLMRKL